jgi:hypothetical protein
MTLKELKNAMNQWVTVKEASDILGTTERTIYRQRSVGFAFTSESWKDCIPA